MGNEFERMDLNNVGDGTLAAAFATDIEKVLADFDDEQKKTGDKRSINMKVEFFMDDDGRVNLVCSTEVKLATRRKKKSFALLRDGKLMQFRDQQQELPATEGKVHQFGGGR